MKIITKNKIDGINKILNNVNFKNNQNYIFEKKKNSISNDGLFYPIYKYDFIQYLNGFFNSYIITNIVYYSFIRFIAIFYFNNLNTYKIKGFFWQINNIYIKKGINIRKELKKWDDENFIKILGITNKEIYDNFKLGTKYIETDNIIYEIEYFDKMNTYVFLNYINRVYIDKKYNLFTKKTDFFLFGISIITLLIFITIFSL